MTPEETARVEALEQRVATLEEALAALAKVAEPTAAADWDEKHRAFVNDVRTGNVLGG
jgi:hypothetical protein